MWDNAGVDKKEWEPQRLGPLDSPAHKEQLMDTTTLPRDPETGKDDASAPLERIAQAVERELERLKAARPHLAPRISRAENILVTHLSCRRQRVIRVRAAGGRARFLVSGSKGAVYVVDPRSWECSCPDHHRRGAACKHSIACWALWRASARPAPEQQPEASAPPALEPEGIPSELLEELDQAGRGRRSLRRDRVRRDCELPVVDPDVLERMAERMGVA